MATPLLGISEGTTRGDLRFGQHATIFCLGMSFTSTIAALFFYTIAAVSLAERAVSAEIERVWVNSSIGSTAFCSCHSCIRAIRVFITSDLFCGFSDGGIKSCLHRGQSVLLSSQSSMHNSWNWERWVRRGLERGETASKLQKTAAVTPAT